MDSVLIIPVLQAGWRPHLYSRDLGRAPLRPADNSAFANADVPTHPKSQILSHNSCPMTRVLLREPGATEDRRSSGETQSVAA